MIPRFETLAAKLLVGQRRKMTFATHQPAALWSGFMPRRKEIQSVIGTELYSLEVFDAEFFKNFKPTAEFDKWAAVEVADIHEIPDGMESLALPEGRYAVFVHQGPASAAQKTYNYIFSSWLPTSEYDIDNRPHFAVMGAKYRHNDPESEEEIWIPVRKK